jgi:8-oxo-dGTP pyrophosphatase MutT (NUDIX family)
LEKCRVFDLDRVSFLEPGGTGVREFYVVSAPDWINIIPLTEEDRVVMIRQFRFGIEGFTLEIPGGMCDPGELPVAAAARELREETGYQSGDLIPLGWVHPNPAIQDNRCHSYLARGARKVGSPTPDPDEAFDVVEVALDEIPRLIAGGKITHALVVTAFHLLGVLGVKS